MVEKTEASCGIPKNVTPSRLSAAQVFVRLSYGCTVALGIIFVIAAVGVWDVGVNKTYPVRQAIEWNWRARATNNLADMATNLNRSIALLEPFHGNPAWVFPTPDTDFDQIRLNIIESRDTALAVAASERIGSFGYQQAVQNLQETIVEINDHLALAKGWFVRTPAAVVLAIVYVPLTVMSFGSVLAAGMKDKKTRRRPAAAFASVWCAGSILVAVLLAIIP